MTEYTFPKKIEAALPDYKATASYWVSQLSLLEAVVAPGVRGLQAVTAPILFSASLSPILSSALLTADIKQASILLGDDKEIKSGEDGERFYPNAAADKRDTDKRDDKKKDPPKNYRAFVTNTAADRAYLVKTMSLTPSGMFAVYDGAGVCASMYHRMGSSNQARAITELVNPSNSAMSSVRSSAGGSEDVAITDTKYIRFIASVSPKQAKSTAADIKRQEASCPVLVLGSSGSQKPRRSSQLTHALAESAYVARRTGITVDVDEYAIMPTRKVAELATVYGKSNSTVYKRILGANEYAKEYKYDLYAWVLRLVVTSDVIGEGGVDTETLHERTVDLIEKLYIDWRKEDGRPKCKEADHTSKHYKVEKSDAKPVKLKDVEQAYADIVVDAAEVVTVSRLHAQMLANGVDVDVESKLFIALEAHDSITVIRGSSNRHRMFIGTPDLIIADRDVVRVIQKEVDKRRDDGHKGPTGLPVADVASELSEHASDVRDTVEVSTDLYIDKNGIVYTRYTTSGLPAYAYDLDPDTAGWF